MKPVAILIRIIALALVTFAGPAFSQVFEYPQLPRSVSEVETIVPQGWNILDDVARGDLNQDGIDDVALVIESNTPADHMVMVRIAGSSKPDLNESFAPPRVLVVLFGRSQGGYAVALANSDIIFRADMGGVIGDPFQGVIIDRGSFVLTEFGGSRQRWREVERYRYREDKWRLIGSTTSLLDVVTGESKETDRNYLSGRMKISTTKTDNEDEKPVVVWKSIPKSKRQLFLKTNVKYRD